jgi:hypothetical protein
MRNLWLCGFDPPAHGRRSFPARHTAELEFATEHMYLSADPEHDPEE